MSGGSNPQAGAAPGGMGSLAALAPLLLQAAQRSGGAPASMPHPMAPQGQPFSGMPGPPMMGAPGPAGQGLMGGGMGGQVTPASINTALAQRGGLLRGY
jgi:hypothetical protein